MEFPNDPLWHGKNGRVGDEVQNAGCNVLPANIDEAASAFKKGVPNRLPRPAAKDLGECCNDIIDYIDPDQGMQYPESSIMLTGRHKDAQPVDEDSDLDKHCNRAVEHSTQMAILANVSTNLR